MTIADLLLKFEALPTYMHGYQVVVPMGLPTDETHAIAMPFDPERVFVERVGYIEAVVVGPKVFGRLPSFRNTPAGRRKAARLERGGAGR